MSDYLDLRARGVFDNGRSFQIMVVGSDGIYLFDSGVGCESMCGESLPCAVCGPALRAARRECMRRARKAGSGVTNKEGRLGGSPKRPEEKQRK